MISWKSIKQGTASKSSIESEYHALSSVASEVIWLQQLLKPLEVSIDTTMLLCDKSTIHLTSNPSHYERSKHIDIDCHFIHELVKK